MTFGTAFPWRKLGLLLTTRSLEVCRRMGCQRSVKVETLSEEESWGLFAQRLGNVDDLSKEARDVAKLVVKECGVFDVHEWYDRLEELKSSTRIHEGIENEVFPSLQLSYNRLKNVKLQDCFLSSALYPEDYILSKKGLVNFWIMEGHLEEIQSRQGKLNLAHTMLNRLISASLLELTGSYGDRVKMHDLIRDMAIKISRERHHSMIKAGMQLRKVPSLQEWTEEMSKASLISNNIREIPSGMSPRCPLLSTQLLKDNPFNSIPDSFFQFFSGLRKGARLHFPYGESPSSESFCMRKLSLHSITGKAHKGMEKLVNLECLLLRGCHELCVPFSELPSGLSNIQCLELSCAVKDPQMGDLQKSECLERLTGLHIYDTANFNTYVDSHHFHNLTSYKLILGSYRCKCSLVCFHNRTIIIDDTKFEDGAEAQSAQLPHNIQELQFTCCEFNVRSLADALPSLKSLTRLTRVFIFQCQVLESIWSESSGAKPTLENLEELIISGTSSFRALARGRVELPSGALSSLKKLKMEFCSTTQKLFTPCLFKGQFRNLEEINILVCTGLQEIFAETDMVVDDESKDAIVEANQDMIIELPKLRVLSLTFLTRLVKIRKIGLVCCNSIEEIAVIQCPELKKLPLVLEVLGNGMPLAPPCLQNIYVERDWWESLLWDNSHIKHTLQPFVRIPGHPSEIKLYHSYLVEA